MPLDAYSDLPAVLTVPEVADVLRLSERTVREWIADGRLPVLRLGRLVRVPRHALVETLERVEGLGS